MVTLKKLSQDFIRYQILTESAALSFHTLLSFIPAIAFCFWYLNWIGVTEQGLSLFKDFLVKHLNVDSSSVFLNYFDQWTTTNSASWGFLNIIILLYTLVSLFQKLGETFDRLLEIPVDKEWYLVWGKRMLFTIILPIPIILSLLVFQWVKKDSIFHTIFQMPGVGSWVAFLIPMAVDLVCYYLLYRWLPSKRFSIKPILKTAIFVTVATEVVRYLFQLYSSYSISVDKIYGILVILPLFIFWVQLHWTLILFGAIFLKSVSNK